MMLLELLKKRSKGDLSGEGVTQQIVLLSATVTNWGSHSKVTMPE